MSEKAEASDGKQPKLQLASEAELFARAQNKKPTPKDNRAESQTKSEQSHNIPHPTGPKDDGQYLQS